MVPTQVVRWTISRKIRGLAISPRFSIWVKKLRGLKAAAVITGKKVAGRRQSKSLIIWDIWPSFAYGLWAR